MTKDKINLIDFSVFQYIVILLAFKDFTYLSLFSQLLLFFIVMLDSCRHRNINRSIFRFISYKCLFIFICLMGIFVSNYSSYILGTCYGLVLKLLSSISIIIYVNSKERLNKVIKYMIFASTLLCVRILIEVPFSSWGNERIGTYLAHDSKNSYGNTGITYVLGIVSVYILTSENMIFKKSKIKYLFFIILSFFSILSGSKKQIIFTIIAFLILTLKNNKNILQTLKKVVLSLAILIILFFLIMKVDFMYNALGSRFESFISYFNPETSYKADISTTSRIDFMNEAIRVFYEKPILGVGIDCFKYENRYALAWAENNYLELLADVGIIGFLSYYIIYIFIIKEVLKRKFNVKVQTLAVLICLLFIDLSMVSYSSGILQLYLALIYATIILENKKEVIS